jgi:hypothetical protein
MKGLDKIGFGEFDRNESRRKLLVVGNRCLHLSGVRVRGHKYPHVELGYVNKFDPTIIVTHKMLESLVELQRLTVGARCSPPPAPD